MPIHRIVEQFCMASARCTDVRDLFSNTEAAVRELGFDRLALVHGLWFRRPSHRLIRIDNFGDFADLFVDRHYYRDDPALFACQRINTAFAWSDMCRLIPFTPRREAIMVEADRHGLRTGLTLPVSVTGEPPGCCSFVTSRSILPSRWHCRAAALIGAEAFREARRLHGWPEQSSRLPQLSPRKLEILQLAATGKTDLEIAMILSLKRSTVETYMAQLRLAFDVYSRAQLCVCAVRFGLVAFDDAMAGF